MDKPSRVVTAPSRNVAQSRKRRSMLIFGAFAVVIAGAVIAGLQLGTKSPLIAKGQVELAPGLQEKAKGIHTLFLIVRDAESPMPMPYGAARFSLASDAEGKFESFLLTNEVLRVMNPDATPPKNITIKARLDGDGAGGPDQPGDLVGEASGVKYGQSDVNIVIDKVIE